MLAVLLGLACAHSVAAQAPQGVAARLTTTADLRLGAEWPEAGAPRRPSIGGQIAGYPWRTGAWTRVSVQGTGDYRSRGAEVVFDQGLSSATRLRRSLFTLAGFVGFDLMRSPHTAVNVRVGAAVQRSRTAFDIDSKNGFTADLNDWEALCRFPGFKDRCRSDYDHTAAFGVSVRRNLQRDGSSYVGADFSRTANGHNSAVATVGLNFR